MADLRAAIRAVSGRQNSGTRECLRLIVGILDAQDDRLTDLEDALADIRDGIDTMGAAYDEGVAAGVAEPVAEEPAAEEFRSGDAGSAGAALLEKNAVGDPCDAGDRAGDSVPADDRAEPAGADEQRVDNVGGDDDIDEVEVMLQEIEASEKHTNERLLSIARQSSEAQKKMKALLQAKRRRDAAAVAASGAQ